MKKLIKTLKRVAEDYDLAIKYAKNGIEKIAPENLTDEYITAMAEGMQKVAHKILKMRIKK